MRTTVEKVGWFAALAGALGALYLVGKAFIPDALGGPLPAPPVLNLTGSTTMTLSTGCTTTPTFPIAWARVGKAVTMSFAETAVCTSNATNLLATGLPAKVRPATFAYGVCAQGFDSGAAIADPVIAQIASDGSISFIRAVGSWTASGSKKAGYCTAAFVVP